MTLKLANSEPIASATVAAFLEAPKPEVRTRGRIGGAGPTHLMEMQQREGEHQDSSLHLAKPLPGSTESRRGEQILRISELTARYMTTLVDNGIVCPNVSDCRSWPHPHLEGAGQVC